MEELGRGKNPGTNDGLGYRDLSRNGKKQKKKILVDYLTENLKNHNWWAYRYFICEVLALTNVVGQMFLMDRFFDGEFLTFGLEVLRLTEEDDDERIDPMVNIYNNKNRVLTKSHFDSITRYGSFPG